MQELLWFLLLLGFVCVWIVYEDNWMMWKDGWSVEEEIEW